MRFTEQEASLSKLLCRATLRAVGHALRAVPGGQGEVLKKVSFQAHDGHGVSPSSGRFASASPDRFCRFSSSSR